jgi:[ribosomal protein S5]-alanine N-acetyltransferase
VRVVTTARLTLEPQTAADAEAMFAVLSDPAIYEFENAPPESLEWLRGRFAKLETRRSPDGREQWLNWVVRLDAEAIGYVQATVREDGDAAIAYEFASAHWGRGFAGEAIVGMMAELAARHRARHATAALKRANHRSMRVLERLGFSIASPPQHAQREIPEDEILMIRSIL